MGVTGFDLLVAIIIVVVYFAAVGMQPTKAGKITLGFILGGVIICTFIFTYIMSGH